MDNITPAASPEDVWQPALDAIEDLPAVRTASDIVERIEAQVRAQPVASVLIALLAGIGVASVVSHLTDPRLRPHYWHR